MRRIALLAALALLCLQSLLPATAVGAQRAGAPPARQLDGTQALLEVLAVEYRVVDRTHEAVGAARVRAMAMALEVQLAQWHGGARLTGALRSARELTRELAATRERLQPWPLPQAVQGLATQIGEALRLAGLAGARSERPYKAIDALLTDADRLASHGAAAGARARANAYASEAFALFATGPGERLGTTSPPLQTEVEDAFWQQEGRERGLLTALATGASAGAVARASSLVHERIDTAATVLGDRTIGKDTVIADAAVIVFREGLEAVLILAAITASFVGARRRLRRPVLLGALLGLGATALTYVLAQALVNALGDGGLRLQAITGLLAIAVLLLVTNWFFHRVYWSEWLGRFHRRRRALERIDRFGFLSGQLVGFTLLGLTSVYREGFETVLFLQNLQVSAGGGATALGIAIGLAGTFAVGFVTFKLERKLPYRKMLIATGVLIGLVLGVMVGNTVHSLQGLGWMPSTPTGFDLQLWWGQWLGVYATWEGIGAQLVALLVVYGSYALARALQTRRYKRVPRELPTLARG